MCLFALVALSGAGIVVAVKWLSPECNGTEASQRKVKDQAEATEASSFVFDHHRHCHSSFYGHFNHPKYGTKQAQFKLPLHGENMRTVQQHINGQGLTLSDESTPSFKSDSKSKVQERVYEIISEMGFTAKYQIDILEVNLKQ